VAGVVVGPTLKDLIPFPSPTVILSGIRRRRVEEECNFFITGSLPLRIAHLIPTRRLAGAEVSPRDTLQRLLANLPSLFVLNSVFDNNAKGAGSIGGGTEYKSLDISVSGNSGSGTTESDDAPFNCAGGIRAGLSVEDDDPHGGLPCSA